MVSECILMPKLYYKITFLSENTRNVRHVLILADGNLRVTWRAHGPVQKQWADKNVAISQSERQNCEMATFFQVDKRRHWTFFDETGLAPEDRSAQVTAVSWLILMVKKAARLLPEEDPEKNLKLNGLGCKASLYLC